jgi:tetratricopeptide (TPR) repeat protein
MRRIAAHSTIAMICVRFIAVLAAVATLSAVYGQQPPAMADGLRSRPVGKPSARDRLGPTVFRCAAVEPSPDAPTVSDGVQQKTSTVEALPAPRPDTWPELLDANRAEPVEPSPPAHELEGPRDDQPATDANPAVARHAEILRRAARNSVALGDLPEALARFEKLLQLTPRDYGARFEYVGLLLQAGRLSDGRRQLEQLVDEQAHVGAYRMALGNLLLRLKEYAAARKQFQVLLSDRKLGRQAVIKIAQTLVLENHHAQAREFYDKHIANLQGLDTATKVTLAQLLIDMQRPAEAVRMLKPLHDANPADETVSAPLVLALVRMNERSQALNFIDELTRQPLANPGDWLALASQLYDEQAFPEALALYRELSRCKAVERRARLGVARTYLRLYEVDLAKIILDECQNGEHDLEFTTVLIDYCTLVGDYAEAIELAKQRRRTDKHDVEAIILLADAYHASQQFAVAEATYSKALAKCPQKDEELRREILRLQAKNYLLSRRPQKAAAILNELLRQQPADVGSRILLIEALTKMKCYSTATSVAVASVDGENPRDRFALRTQLGYVLLEQGCWPAAANHFRSLCEASDETSPEVAYGLYRAASMMGQAELARYAFQLGPSRLAPPALWADVFSGKAMVYCDCQTAAAVLDNALRSSPRNVVLLNLRGEAAQLCDCCCDSTSVLHLRANGCNETSACPNPWFLSALRLSPTNIRARLGLARSFNRHMAFDSAEAEYRVLAEQMPGDVNLTRELARMVEGNYGLEEARDLYTARPSLTPVEEDAADLGQFVDDVDIGGEPGSAATGEPEPMLFDQFMSSEFQATSVRGWHLYEAIPAYERLIEAEPWNDSALFGLAQTQSALGRTQCAIDTYFRLLDENPCHEDAATALLRNQLELRPKILPVFDYEKQFGRQGLANMTWVDVSLAMRNPLGDEDEFFEWGYRERLLQPTDDRADFGEIPFFRWQQKYAPDSLMFVELAVEKYQYGLKTRPTFKAGLDLLVMDDFEASCTGFLENYYVCGEAIRQDIYTAGIQFNAIYRPRRLWTLAGYYRTASLSDNNWVNWLNLNSANVLMEGRKQIRALVDMDFYGFQHQTIFGPIPGSLVGTIHPYWSPSAYVFTTMGLEWQHWLSRDRFKGANEHYYSVFTGAAIDSHGIGFFVANGRWQRDVSESLTWAIDFNVIRSPDQIYNAAGASAYGIWRL